MVTVHLNLVTAIYSNLSQEKRLQAFPFQFGHISFLHVSVHRMHKPLAVHSAAEQHLALTEMRHTGWSLPLSGCTNTGLGFSLLLSLLAHLMLFVVQYPRPTPHSFGSVLSMALSCLTNGAETC